MTVDLYEYQNKEQFNGDIVKIKTYLDKIWNNRPKYDNYFQDEADSYDEEISKKQKFISFLDDNYIKSQKHVGIIQVAGDTINLYPKIFYNSDSAISKNVINLHILWWLSHCRKIRFPNFRSAFKFIKNDFFEILIYLFASFTRKTLNNYIYQTYENVSDDLSFIKGRINFPAYINNMTKSNYHKIPCEYDSFEIDNNLNRIIKYVSKLLIPVTCNYENRKTLEEIVFILEDVSDNKAGIEDCNKVKLNPMFEELENILNYCRMFISNSIVFDNGSLKLFAFLLPMEYIFEDFIFGFMEKEFPEISIESKKEINLDESGEFKIINDIICKIKGMMIVIDTKYKLIFNKELKPAQTDLYQMIAYAVRRKSENVFLFYPELINNRNSSLVKTHKIPNAFIPGNTINIFVSQLPIIDISINLDQNKRIDEIFFNCRNLLKTKITALLGTL